MQPLLLSTTRCRSLEEFREIDASPENRAAAMAAFETGLIASAEITPVGNDRFTIPGHCLVCSQDVAFQVGYEHCFSGAAGGRTPNWREHLRCPVCLLNNRMRAAAGFLLALSEQTDAIYLTESITPLFAAMAKQRPGLRGSEYLRDGTKPGERNARGIQHQDVTRLTFSDSTFDLIGSFEVLEHVPAYGEALREFHRCLRPGGNLLLTVPFILSSAETLTRATVDEAGNVTHLLPPEIHGDPLDDTGALCFYHFGWDLLDRLKDIGFEDPGISVFWEPRYGYVGGYQFVITAQKPAGPAKAAAWAGPFHAGTELLQRTREAGFFGRPAPVTNKTAPASYMTLPNNFALPHLITDIADADTSFDGHVDRYLQTGVSARKIIEAAMIGAAAPKTILDMACGFGQVTRFLRACYPSASITVCDRDRAAVNFCAATFKAQGVTASPDFRDLDIKGSFDLIWAGSLTAQLPEHQLRQFLDFAVRHMGPQTRLIAGSHGDHVATLLRTGRTGLSDSACRGLIVQYLDEGFGYRNDNGNPASGMSLAARAWYEALLNESPLRLQAFYERGWDRHQDVLVMRCVSPARIWPLRRNPARLFEHETVALPLPPDAQAVQDEQGVCRFDEAWYLETFKDVADVVRKGGQASGADHYLLFGWTEGRPPFDSAQTYAARAASAPGAWLNGIVGGANRVDEAWSVDPQDTAEDVGWYWMAHPTVRARSNVLASGNPKLDAYDRLVVLLAQRGITVPIGQSISIGCGFGGLERDLSHRKLVSQIDAYDIATGAIAEAERQAREGGFDNIHYHVANLEKIALKRRSLDVVFAHSSVHHVENVEALYAVVQRALRPGGLFHLHEYVGPTRFQWTDTQLELANAFLDSLPPRLRQLPNGQPKEKLRRPTIEEMIAADPSEAIRSAELVGCLAAFFDIVEIKPLGGTLAHIALGGIAQNFEPGSAEDEALLERLFVMEDTALAEGTISSDFATITAAPRTA